jgi:hypothetical protein
LLDLLFAPTGVSPGSQFSLSKSLTLGLSFSASPSLRLSSLSISISQSHPLSNSLFSSLCVRARREETRKKKEEKERRESCVNFIWAVASGFILYKGQGERKMREEEIKRV